MGTGLGLFPAQGVGYGARSYLAFFFRRLRRVTEFVCDYDKENA